MTTYHHYIDENGNLQVRGPNGEVVPNAINNLAAIAQTHPEVAELLAKVLEAQPGMTQDQLIGALEAEGYSIESAKS